MNFLPGGTNNLFRLEALAALADNNPDRVKERLLEKLRERSHHIALLESQLSEYRESQWFYESWVAWLEGRLRYEGIDPNDMWDEGDA